MPLSSRLLAAGFSCILLCSASAALAGPRAAEFATDEIIVKYRHSSDALGLKAALGMITRRSLIDGQVELLSLPSITTVNETVEMLRQDARVEYAEPNFRRRKMNVIPNDPQFIEQWGLRNTGQANFVSGGPAGTPGFDLNLSQAWDSNGDGTPDRVGSPSVIVAVIDDGVETAHEDLAANIVAGYNFKDNNSNPNPVTSDDFHGTEVAGCIGAVGNNGLGVSGVSWRSKIMPLRFDFDVATHVAAMEFARKNGARIVNASFGGPGFSQSELDEIRLLGNNDILYVTSAGNDDSNIDRGQISYPANYDADNIVAVAGISRQGQISSFSQYGPLSVDVAAPGLQIITTATGNSYTLAANGGSSGTSFSSPYVAGVAALIRSSYPSATYREVKARLIESGRNLGNAKQLTVGGAVDANAALAATPPKATLVIKSVAVDAAGNGKLDPGETATLDVVVQNQWQTASNVSVQLSADNDGLMVSGGPISLGNLAQGATANARFQVTVPAALSGHHYEHFTFTLTASGYNTTRSYIDEVGALTLGTAVSASFAGNNSDLYDDFQAWDVDLASGNGGYLVVEGTSAGDIDLLLKQGTPPQYDITLGIDSAAPTPNSSAFYCTSGINSQCLDSATIKANATTSGTERACIAKPIAGTYHIVVVNFGQPDAALPYQLKAYASNNCGPATGPVPPAAAGSAGGGGGGSLGGVGLAILAAAAALRRRADGAPKTGR